MMGARRRSAAQGVDMNSLLRIVARIGSALMAFWASLCYSVPDVDDWKPSVSTRDGLEGLADEVRRETGVPGLAVALIHGDSVLTAVSGHLSVEESKQLNLEHRLHIGSVSKGITALLIADMVQRNELSWDTTLEQALPGLEMHSDFRKVTIHQLLVNQAGLLGYQNTESEDAKDVSFLDRDLPARRLSPGAERQAVAEYVLSRAPFYKPGTRALYSNVGWALLGLIVERRAGKSFEDLLSERILEPLEMKGVRVGGWPASNSDPNQPRGHYMKDGEFVAQPLEDEYRLPNWLNSAGGLHMTIQDFALYARDALRGLRGEEALLPGSYYRAIHSEHIAVPVRELYPEMNSSHSLRMGYGWALMETNRGSLSAGEGSAGTFFASVLVFPYLNVAVVTVTNCGDRTPSARLIKRLTGIPWG